MSGIIFLKTANLEKIRSFYVDQIGMEVWLEQKGIALLKHGNLLLGLHETGDVDRFGLITFFYPLKEDVDRMYERFKDVALGAPKVTEQYRVYNFFARDPEGRKLEFQAFLHPVAPYLDGREALITRRSVRKFTDVEVSRDRWMKLFEMCRYAPTSMNTQSYTYHVIKEREKLAFLASLRGKSSSPIANAPHAVAISADPGKTKRPDQDGCIAAYHFVIAAWLHGLGTCWIAAMDRDDAKDCIGIPRDHYLATVTPVGYPARLKGVPERRAVDEFVRFL